ncbi:MAG: hypothetical protein DRJ31_04340 [Candidatus Methanomethylicota archaeon]|uniref:Phosphoserine phosphatase n=1 Tax=Thermoproteota archaeon TaxID=2056631 RepID=A0A497EQV2_9CREN|nr:MAG: hypothetical protein DRJ31_04340 [Candidatus Verstraetearchaeota archaeon]RLE52288.1 MAG: hypothetical protein DRJ33_04185 [Candidatus Verstraetearchaeota archaeon]
MPIGEELAQLLAEEASLLSFQNQLLATFQSYVAKKREIIQEIKALREQARQEKELRDQVNQKITELKNSRKELNVKRLKLLDEARKLEREAKSLIKGVNASEEELIQKLNELEWKYQTSSLSLEEDKRMVQIITALEHKLKLYEKYRQLLKEADKKRALSEQVKAEVGNIHNQILSLSKESNEHHKRLLEAKERARRLREEVNRLSEQIAQVKNQIQELKPRLREVRLKIRTLKEQLAEEKAIELAKRAQAVIEKQRQLAHQAKEKLKRGEKLSFEEFSALMEFEGLK